MLKVLNGCKTPTKGSLYSAGVDLYSSENTIVYPNATSIIGLGVEIDKDYIAKTEIEQKEIYLELHPRSSLRAKGIVAGVGIIDIDYIGHEIKIIVHNLSEKPFTVEKGDKIAQLLVKQHKTDLLGYQSLERRNGGIGSTGEI